MSCLYITTQGGFLHKKRNRLIVTKGKEVILDVPVFKVDQIVLFGKIQLSPHVRDFLIDQGIDLCFLSRFGYFRARLNTGLRGTIPLRQKQIELLKDSHFSLSMAKGFVRGKLLNCYTISQAWKRKGLLSSSTDKISALKKIILTAEKTDTVDSLRGYEGSGGRIYFEILSDVIKNSCTGFQFTDRNRHPPKDPVNAMLSLAYTMLYKHIYSVINIVGLDPYCGFFHSNLSGETSLAFDLMEEFRPVIADILVVKVINMKIIKPDDFTVNKEQVLLSEEGLKKFIREYEKRIQSTVTHPVYKKQFTYFKCFELQSRLLGKAIMEGPEAYVPFLIK